MRGGPYSVRMSVRSLKEMPGIEFVVDARGRRKSVVIDLVRYGALWEDLFDAYVAQQRRAEPRESLSKVKTLVQSAPKQRASGRLQSQRRALRPKGPPGNGSAALACTPRRC